MRRADFQFNLIRLFRSVTLAIGTASKVTIFLEHGGGRRNGMLPDVASRIEGAAALELAPAFPGGNVLLAARFQRPEQRRGPFPG